MWQLLQIDGDGMSAFALGSARASLGAQILAWLIVTELLGLAVFGMLWHFGVPLPDRGILSARFCGLLLFGFPPALLAASGLVPVTRPLLLAWFAVLLIGGLVALLAHRAVVWHFVRRHRTQFLVCQSLVVGVYALALAIRRLAPAAFPAPTGFGLAQWAAMLRSPVLPPPDPLFAGGELVVPYATLVPLASTARLLALPPDLALNLALATTLTLLVSLVWVVAASPMPGREPRPMSSISAGYALPWLAVLLLLAPGAPVHELRSLAPIGMLAAGSLPALAGLAVAAGALVLVRGIRITEGNRRRVEWRRWIGPGIALALAAASLGLVRAQDRWVFLALIGPSMLVLWRSLDRAGTRRGRVMLTLLAGTLVLAQPFVVAFQLLAAPGALLSTQRALASLALALSSILLCLSVVARFADRVLMSGVVVVVAGSMLASVMLGLPFVVPLVGLAGLLLWLVVEATIRKRGRVSALVVALVSALAGSVLIVPADLIRAGYLAGNPQFVFGAVLLLLVFAFARAAAYLVRFVRPRQPFVLVFATGLLVGTLLMSVTQTVLPRSRDAANDSTAPQSIGLHQAIQAIATDARGAATVAVAPTSAVSPLVEATGLPALLSAPQIGGAQRAILRPSYDAVVSGRARALADIYGPDAERAAEQLTRFAVRYVLVGPEEYGMYGSGAGAGLRQLAASGRIAEVYGGDGVFLYRNVAVPDVPPYVAEAVELPVPPLRASLPSP